MSVPTSATREMGRPGLWAVRTPLAITYGPDEDWAWRTAENVAQTPGNEWVQILPPLERWDEWPSPDKPLYRRTDGGRFGDWLRQHFPRSRIHPENRSRRWGGWR